MRPLTIVLALAISAPAMAQPSSDPMTSPVTPRDVRWYTAHPSVMDQTLAVCYGNAAYANTADCQNANAASAGLLGQAYSNANDRAFTRNPALDIRNPAYWSANPIAREATLAQCRRRGPGDEMAYPYCGVASQSRLSDLGRR
jgi:hypothetical protein